MLLLLLADTAFMYHEGVLEDDSASGELLD
jgi:hypothetical protein